MYCFQEHAFISQVLQPVLASDDSGASLPIIGVSNSPASIDQMFSTYTYDKVKIDWFWDEYNYCTMRATGTMSIMSSNSTMITKNTMSTK